jgi:hypothetical protein
MARVQNHAMILPCNSNPRPDRIFGKDNGAMLSDTPIVRRPGSSAPPLEVKGAMPGDVLEVRILDINLILDWGYNRQRAYTGALPEEFTGVWTRIIPLDRETKTAEVASLAAQGLWEGRPSGPTPRAYTHPA